jgi:hypothetical protein
MIQPDSLFSRIVRDLIWVFLGISLFLLFVHDHVNCDVSGILGDVQMGLCAASFLLSLITHRFGTLIVSALLFFIVPAFVH